MTDISKFLIPPGATVLEAMSAIDTGAKGIAFICSDKKIKAVITDGDIRRYIIGGGDLSRKVIDIANRNYKHLTETDMIDPDLIARIKIHYKAVPVLDADGKILSIVFDDETASLPHHCRITS